MFEGYIITNTSHEVTYSQTRLLLFVHFNSICTASANAGCRKTSIPFLFNLNRLFAAEPVSVCFDFSSGQVLLPCASPASDLYWTLFKLRPLCLPPPPHLSLTPGCEAAWRGGLTQTSSAPQPCPLILTVAKLDIFRQRLSARHSPSVFKPSADCDQTKPLDCVPLCACPPILPTGHPPDPRGRETQASPALAVSFPPTEPRTSFSQRRPASSPLVQGLQLLVEEWGNSPDCTLNTILIFCHRREGGFCRNYSV